MKLPSSNNSPALRYYSIIFFVSLFCIILELFFTRILNLKTWNHIVYVIIPFAILGYGIGANFYLIFRQKIHRHSQEKILSLSLRALAILTPLCLFTLIDFPVQVDTILRLFTGLDSLLALLSYYTIVMIPFIFIGFIVVYLFSINPHNSAKLYFFDLLGAGFGAYLFFPLINSMEVGRSILFLCLLTLALSFYGKLLRNKLISIMILSLLPLLVLLPVEPRNYRVDERKGWEWIPGFLPPDRYKTTLAAWHPLGRTDVYRIIDKSAEDLIIERNPFTFQINLHPTPEFSYISTNFLAGTPIYKLSAEGITERNTKLELFSKAIEVPYVLLHDPKVVIIGTGGGRDIFMAKTHNAQEIVGAEINPVTFKELSLGGKLYEYSGGVYTLTGTKIYNMDGRHLVKILKPNTYDLVVLNGVDTFSGLSTGAYAYAESYLYTKNAVLDYLKVLSENGIINFNRWLDHPLPRETLRLHAIALQALKDSGVKTPTEHIMIGKYAGWSLMLIKKSPFTSQEKGTIQNYLKDHEAELIYPTLDKNKAINNFDIYSDLFKKNELSLHLKDYPYDISVITDDSPFFYKYYKLSNFDPFKVIYTHHEGNIIFLTQILIFAQALIFILLFIFLPLLTFQGQNLKRLGAKQIFFFVTYFSCLGLGFMFIEIPYMQKFTLLLGSPIYSISVTLSILLISTGLGSLALPYLNERIKDPKLIITGAGTGLIIFIFFLETMGPFLLNYFMGYSFFVRALIMSVLLFPVGFILGLFFPSGLKLISNNKETIAWAWGINCGFSVLGSILSIIVAQFIGFRAVIMLALGVYMIAVLSFKKINLPQNQ